MNDNNKTEVLEHRVSSLERAFEQTNRALQGINDSLRQLTALEARHVETKAEIARAFDSLKDHESRLRAIEQSLPELRTASTAVMRSVFALVAMAGVAAAKILFGW